ncbi:hypothetical protein [Mycolicibacterium pallens]|uniref:Uncharacterized protein n=1 Tax=Mycolicibacterium pallens TaxID=370524 RepID=A0ABX8VMX9_9MYCO|nr:hypothetical protein [Mycolicibacterium pallens]QYL18423.1 hypothetical protein K0O64_07920 [Mycolicibacterium pallens]
MPKDERLESFAEYLRNNPTQAEGIAASMREMYDQVSLANEYATSVAKQWEETRERITKALKRPVISLDFLPDFAKALDGLYPANWPRPIPDVDKMEEVLSADGIPITHVPRAEIVRAIVDAADYDARINIIEDRANDIAEDCKAALAKDFHKELCKQIPLAQRAIEAFQAGFFEAAQTLAVSICDTYLKKLYSGTSYTDMAKKLAIENTDAQGVAWAFNVGYAFAPGASFLTPWRPGKGEEPPTRLSRHVTIHFASTDHVNKLNSTISIMFLTSMTIAINYAFQGVRLDKEST